MENKTLVEHVVSRVAKSHGVSAEAVYGFEKPARLVEARFACWYLLRRYGRMGLREIGEAFGREHSSIHHGISRFERWIRVDEELRALLLDALDVFDEDTNTGMIRRVSVELEHSRAVTRRLEALLDRLEDRAIRESEPTRRRTVLAVAS